MELNNLKNKNRSIIQYNRAKQTKCLLFQDQINHSNQQSDLVCSISLAMEHYTSLFWGGRQFLQYTTYNRPEAIATLISWGPLLRVHLYITAILCMEVWGGPWLGYYNYVKDVSWKKLPLKKLNMVGVHWPWLRMRKLNIANTEGHTRNIEKYSKWCTKKQGK